MKFLHIVAGMDPSKGGVTEAVRSMIEGLDSHNILNDVVSLDVPGGYLTEKRPFKIVALGPAKTAWRYSDKLKPWLRKNIQIYDVVIIHGLWQYHTYAVYSIWKVLKHTGPRLLIMPHGMLDPYFQRISVRGLKVIRNLFFWYMNEGRAINKADGLLFTCETEKMLAAETFRSYHPKREAVVGLGINPVPLYEDRMKAAFNNKCNGINTDEYILYISRLHPKKAADLLIKAYLKLKLDHFLLPKLVIAGPGLDTEYGSYLQELAKNNPDIIFTGMLTGDERWGAFYNCSALALPSHQENFGFVVVEAMACGKPVLISDQVNIWREVKAANAGFIEEDTEDGVLHLLQRWARLTDIEKKKMGQNAIAAFNRYFSLEKSTERLLSFTQTL